MELIDNITLHLLTSSQGKWYGYVLQRLEKIKTTNVPTLAVHGENGKVYLSYNEDFLKKFPLQQQIALVEHELLHVGNNHINRFKWLANVKDPQLGEFAAISMDCAINQFLSNLPEGVVTLQTFYNYVNSHSSSRIQIEPRREAEYYFKLLQKTSKEPQNGNIVSCGTPCDHMKHGNSGSNQQDKLDEQSRAKFEQSLIQAGADCGVDFSNRNKQMYKANNRSYNSGQGQLPSGVDMLIESIVAKTELNWKDILNSRCAMYIKADKKPSWKRLRRRSEMELKGFVFNRKPRVVVAVDTSGSIYSDPELLKEFGGQLEKIRDAYQAEFTVIECDAAIHKIYKMNKFKEVDRKFRGGGETDFRPVFDKCEKELNPSILVFLTDGMGTFPEQQPKFKTIWCSIQLEPNGYPFGDVIMLQNGKI